MYTITLNVITKEATDSYLNYARISCISCTSCKLFLYNLLQTEFKWATKEQYIISEYAGV